jgi:hypothetical protein
VLQLPVTFALRSTTGHQDRVLAIGMTLPDGGAVTVDWRAGRAGTVSVWSSPDAAAGAHHADLIWYRRSPGPDPLTGPPNGALWRFAS